MAQRWCSVSFERPRESFQDADHFDGQGSRREAVVIGFFADKTVAVHITDRRNKHSVWRVGPSEPANLFERETEFQAALSPDGGQIAIATPSLGLELVPVAAGAGRRLVTSEMGEQISAVAWSPDSKRLVFVRYPHDVESNLSRSSELRGVDFAW